MIDKDGNESTIVREVEKTPGAGQVISAIREANKVGGVYEEVKAKGLVMDAEMKELLKSAKKGGKSIAETFNKSEVIDIPSTDRTVETHVDTDIADIHTDTSLFDAAGEERENREGEGEICSVRPHKIVVPVPPINSKKSCGKSPECGEVEGPEWEGMLGGVLKGVRESAGNGLEGMWD